jgi:hypothetical protein
MMNLDGVLIAPIPGKLHILLPFCITSFLRYLVHSGAEVHSGADDEAPLTAGPRFYILLSASLARIHMLALREGEVQG